MTREGWGAAEEQRNAAPPRADDPALHISSARAGLQPIKCVMGTPRRDHEGETLQLEDVEGFARGGGDDEGFSQQQQQQQQQSRFRSQVPAHAQQHARVSTLPRGLNAYGAFAARPSRRPNFKKREGKNRTASTTATATTTVTNPTSTTSTTTAFQTRKRITSSSSLDSALGDDEYDYDLGQQPWAAAATQQSQSQNVGGGGGASFATRTTYSPWGAHDDAAEMGDTIQSQPKTWIPFSAGLESQRLPFLQQRLMTHTFEQKRRPDPTPTPVTLDTYRDHGPDAYKRAHGIAAPNPADPYRRHHPGARNTATASTSEGLEKGTLVRRTMLPNGEWVNMAQGFDSSRCDEPEAALFKQTTARGTRFLTPHGASSNPNPVFDEREHWQVAATNRLAGTSLRNDPEKKLWPGVTGCVSGLNFLTSDVPLVAQHRWALDRMND